MNLEVGVNGNEKKIMNLRGTWGAGNDWMSHDGANDLTIAFLYENVENWVRLTFLFRLASKNTNLISF